MNPEQSFLKEDPRVVFEALATQILATPPIDVELPIIENLRKMIENGTLTPKQALAKLEKMSFSRQDYH